MTPERWRQAEQLCEAALKLPVDQRETFLQRACETDASLRQLVETLLEGHDRPDFLAGRAMEVAARGMARQGGFLVGQQIRQYRILSMLGAGGMGEVYRAHDDHLQRDVAIKVLSDAAFNDVPARSLLLREARSAAALNHSNVCTIYEVGEADGLAYIAMELIEGQSLSDRISEGGLSNSEVLRYGLQIADAVGHAHEKGVIHRDLKTSNILVGRQRQVKVLDFGLAKRINRDQLSAAAATQSATFSTQPGVLVGTMPYMAPEQWRAKPADPRTDVWALGVVLYELAAGIRPFRGETTHDLSASILTQAPPPLPEKVSPPLVAVIQRCLQKEPGDRYADGGEVKAALEVIPVTSTGIVATERPKRRPYIYLPIGAAALLMLALALTWMPNSTNAPTAPITPQTFTNFAGWEIWPTWSPDGSRIAYSHIVGSSADIAVMSPGGDPQILTRDSPADEFKPAFSPTGSRIAYVSDRGSGTNIYTIPASGGSERMIAETHIPFLQRMGAWAGSLGSNPWSPDETELVFSRLEPNGDVALYVVKLDDTRTERRLTSPPAGAEDSDAAWSPDSQSIAFTRTHGGPSKLWVIPARGGTEFVILEDGNYDVMPAWTPDSRALVFSSTRSGNLNLWEIQLGSQTPTQVTFGPGMDFAPAVARNGSIAFGQFDHEIDIYRVNLESRNLEEDPGERLTTFTGENFGPRISRNGTILYHSNRADPTNADVWMIDESGAHQNLTDHSAVDRLADWSADGKEIVFMSDREDAVRLWVLEVATGKTRRLTPREQHLTPATHSAEAEGGPRWSPDNKLIAYLAPAAEGSTIWVVGTEDGSNPQATNIRGATSFAWYKDSKRLIYTRQPRGGSAQELIATNLETGEEQVLRKGAIAEIAVSADGNWLSFMNSVSHFTMDLFVMSLGPAGSNGLPRAGAEKQVTFGKGVWHAHAGGFSADGKSLVYSRDRDFGNIHVMEKNTQK